MKQLKFLSLIFLLCALPAFAQNQGKPEEHKFVAIEPTDIILTIASQPDSPLQIENAKYYYDLNTGRPDYRFDVRNRGTKPIVNFTSEVITIIGTGGTLSNDWNGKKSVLLPGKVFVDDIDKKQIVSLTPEIREKLKFGPEVKGMVMLIVYEVLFADGTKYDGSKQEDAFTKYFQNVGSCRFFDKL